MLYEKELSMLHAKRNIVIEFRREQSAFLVNKERIVGRKFFVGQPFVKCRRIFWNGEQHTEHRILILTIRNQKIDAP